MSVNSFICSLRRITMLKTWQSVFILHLQDTLSSCLGFLKLCLLPINRAVERKFPCPLSTYRPSLNVVSSVTPCPKLWMSTSIFKTKNDHVYFSTSPTKSLISTVIHYFLHNLLNRWAWTFRLRHLWKQLKGLTMSPPLPLPPSPSPPPNSLAAQCRTVLRSGAMDQVQFETHLTKVQHLQGTELYSFPTHIVWTFSILCCWQNNPQNTATSNNKNNKQTKSYHLSHFSGVSLYTSRWRAVDETHSNEVSRVILKVVSSFTSQGKWADRHVTN